MFRKIKQLDTQTFYSNGVITLAVGVQVQGKLSPHRVTTITLFNEFIDAVEICDSTVEKTAGISLKVRVPDGVTFTSQQDIDLALLLTYLNQITADLGTAVMADGLMEYDLVIV